MLLGTGVSDLIILLLALRFSSSSYWKFAWCRLYSHNSKYSTVESGDKVSFSVGFGVFIHYVLFLVIAVVLQYV